jgi:hypothetical protein
MKLSAETLARERPQRHPMPSAQPELPEMPDPMTANRAKDFGFNAAPPCKRCQIQCDYCLDYMADHRTSGR